MIDLTRQERDVLKLLVWELKCRHEQLCLVGRENTYAISEASRWLAGDADVRALPTLPE